MNEEYVKVPKDRLAVLIGKEGNTKEVIEASLNVTLEIDSVDSSIQILDNEATTDPLAVWKGRDIVKAIARGFAPEKALRLKDDGVIVEIIDISGFVGDSKNGLHRMKARLIGQEGKTRRSIEENTGVYISIYGKTISILGTFDEVYDAKKAVMMLLEGKPHSGVYRYLEKIHKERKEQAFQKKRM